MATYVHIVVGSYDILVDAQSVLEVAPYQDSGDSGGCRTWRSEALPVVNGVRLLGGVSEMPPGASIVFAGDDGSRFFLDVGTVKGIRRVEDREFRPLPPLPEVVGQIFDGIVLEQEGRLGLRLRGGGDLLAHAGRREPVLVGAA